MTSSEILTKFWQENGEKAIPFDWLRGRSYSDAFAICIGAGPWKFGRRKAIQEQALKILNGRDLISLVPNEIQSMYPLGWQRKFTRNAVQNLHCWGWGNKGFEKFCSNRNHNPGRRVMLSLVGAHTAKVISLFCRDALKVPCFPIDRHVRRKLIQLGLPPDEDLMIELCQQTGIDPCEAAVAFVRVASDMDNPDWSV